MLKEHLRSKVVEVKSHNIQIVYNLFFNNTQYSIECYKKEFQDEEPINYSLVEDFTDDEGQAEDFLNHLVRGKVYPVHIKELVDDYFNY